MSSIALAIMAFHFLASLALLAAFAFDTPRRTKYASTVHGSVRAVFEPSDEEILLTAVATSARRPVAETAAERIANAA